MIYRYVSAASSMILYASQGVGFVREHNGLFHELNTVHDLTVSYLLLPPQIKPLALRPVKVSEDEAVQELSRPHRSNSKEQLSEVSPWMRPFPFS